MRIPFISIKGIENPNLLKINKIMMMNDLINIIKLKKYLNNHL